MVRLIVTGIVYGESTGDPIFPCRAEENHRDVVQPGQVENPSQIAASLTALRSLNVQKERVPKA